MRADRANERYRRAPKPRATRRTANWALLALPLALFSCSTQESADGFRQVALNPAVYSLFDLGVTDVDNDGRLDVFTVNHSSPQSVLLNRGGGLFEEAFDRLGLDQDAGFPGLASTEQPFELVDRGLYVYWVGAELIVQAHDLDAPATGRIRLDSALQVTGRDGAEVSVEKSSRSENDQSSSVSFRLDRRGRLSLLPEIHALPMEVDVAGVPAERIFVGPSRVSPPSARFTFFLKDRHGMVWFDYDSDGAADLFITRGGQSGLMRYKEAPFWDEFFAGRRGVYEADAGKALGFSKDGCPGRKAGAADFDGDGRLDIYVVCGRGGEVHANKLFRRVDDQRFADVAPAAGLDIGGAGSFVWLDVDLDGDLDMFWDGDTEVGLYRNDRATFTREPAAGGLRDEPAKHLSVADYDNDGDLDVFSACQCGNVLFRNDDGGLVPVDPTAMELPGRSHTAGWVDYDNDGDLDLHAIPNGLYEQSPAGRFAAAGLLVEPNRRLSLRQASDGVASWFDFNHDGARDLVYAVERRLKRRRWVDWIVAAERAVGLEAREFAWEVFLLENERNLNNWLQVDLVGAPGNREAIGARVEIEYGAEKRLQQAGSAEGSHYSQGHYRLYFGLGPAEAVDRLRVTWPNGTSSEVLEPEINRIVVIRQQ